MKSFYTRSGDGGWTGLLGKERILKHSLRIETIGCLDEANALLGVVRSQTKDNLTVSTILDLQKKLYQIMTEVAATDDNKDKFFQTDQGAVDWLEELVEQFSSQVIIPNKFIVPGDSQTGAFLSLARTVFRRAERRVSEMVEKGELENKLVLAFLNRVSSLCFVMELYENSLVNPASPTLTE